MSTRKMSRPRPPVFGSTNRATVHVRCCCWLTNSVQFVILLVLVLLLLCCVVCHTTNGTSRANTTNLIHASKRGIGARNSELDTRKLTANNDDDPTLDTAGDGDGGGGGGSASVPNAGSAIQPANNEQPYGKLGVVDQCHLFVYSMA